MPRNWPPDLACAPPDVGEHRHYLGEHGGHAHAHTQVLFGVRGGLDVEVEGRLMRVDASAGLVIPAGAQHTSASRHGAEVWVVDTHQQQGLDRIRAFALPEVKPNLDGTHPWLECARNAARTLPRRKLEPKHLAQLISSALHEDWPAARLAQQAALSVPQFHARWRALTGLTPQAWLRTLRLDEAERLLRIGWPADTVASQVGYASASALLSALRRERGVGVRTLRAQDAAKPG